MEPRVPHQPGYGGWKLFGIATVDRPERERHLRRELARVPLPHEVHRFGRLPESAGFASTGERGCFESHLTSLRRALAESVDVAVIVEDDSVIVRRLPRLLPIIASELATLDWAVCYLGYLGSQSPCSRERVRMVTPHIAMASGWEVHGSHFVAIRRDALRDLIANFEERLQPSGHRIGSDGVLNEFRRDLHLPTLLAMPNLARQGPSPSGISEKPGIRTTLLRKARIRGTVESVKRLAWDAEAFAPPAAVTWAWNVRSRLRGRAECVDGAPRPA